MKLPAWINTAVAALAGAVLPACDGLNLQEIRPGITTQAEVRARMGEPGRIHWNDDGSAVWEYNRQPNGVHCHMIAFNRDRIVAGVEQVLNERNYARIREGMSKDEVARLLGAPGSQRVFANLGEEIWEWHVEGIPPIDETYFVVHFSLDEASVKKAAKRIERRG